MKKSIRTRVAILAVVSLGLTAAACGGDDDDATDEVEEPADDAVDEPAEEPAEEPADDGTDEPAEEPADDGDEPATSEPSDDGDAAGDLDPNAVFRFGDTLPITTLDPHKATGAGYNVWLFPVYDRLVHVGPDGSTQPGLATDWEFSDDGLTLTMNLREGVVFHDGTPFDADAVKANLDRGQTLDVSAVANDLAIFTAIEVVDPLTIALTLAAPNATAPLVLSERAGAIASPAAFDTLDLQPVGTGMFTVSAFEPSVSATYERFDGYWDPEAVQVAGMEFTTIADSLQRANALKAGEIDATLLDAPQVADVEAAGLNVDSAPNYLFFHLQMNRTRAGLDDVLVRQALNFAIDREALVEGLFFGLADPAFQPYPAGSPGHVPALDELYPYDPDRARELLAEAGAEDLAFEIVTLNIPSYVQLAEVVQAQLAEVGVTATIVETTNVSQTFYVDATGDTTVIQWTGRPDPAITAQQLYTDGGFSNPGRHTTDEVMAAFDEAVTVTDPDARTAALESLTTAIVEQAMDVPLYFPYANLAYTDQVVGFQNWVTGKMEFRGVGMTE